MANLQKKKRMARIVRHRRVRARVLGTLERPRISVFRSHMHMYAQLIDDARSITVVHAWDGEVHVQDAAQKDAGARQVLRARAVGKLLAERAIAKGITRAVFDRGGYAYHGRIAAVADGARESGLEF